MSNNKYRPELQIWSEDLATMQLAQGFVDSLGVCHRSVRVMPYRSGWLDVPNGIKEARLAAYPMRHCLALIDFDGCGDDRIKRFRDALRDPNVALNRVYVIGPATNVEKMRSSLAGQFADIKHIQDVGKSFAEACRDKVPCKLLADSELKHNVAEFKRLCDAVRSFVMLP